MVEKTCVVCKAVKPEQDFTKQRMYRRNTCKSCTSNRVKQYWKDNPEKYIQTKDLKRQRQHRRHGLSDETYASMLDKYDGLCYACREERAVCIDHDHSCCPGTYGCDSCVRGLLCQNCNWALGNLKDSVDRANKLIKYMVP